MPVCLASRLSQVDYQGNYQYVRSKSGTVEAEADDHQESVPPITESQHMYAFLVRCFRTSYNPCLGLARLVSRAAFLGWAHRSGGGVYSVVPDSSPGYTKTEKQEQIQAEIRHLTLLPKEVILRSPVVAHSSP